MRLLFSAALALTFAAAGCSGVFHNGSAPEGYDCSPTGGCPPGQQCVPGEKKCRTPCTQTSLSGMITGGAMQCGGIDNNNGNNSGYSCDYDHFCRPSCFGSNGTCTGGCPGTDVCDATVGICRPTCVGGCPSTWGCSALSTNGGTTVSCAGCVPLATSKFTPPTFAPIVFYDTVGGGASNFITVGDLAGTGKPWVVAVDMSGQKLYVYGNDGTGVLAAPVSYPVGPSPREAVVVDITRDGKQDVVVGTVLMGGSSGPKMLPGNGDGTLGAVVAGPNPFPNVRLSLGDFDGDGKLDVVGCGGYDQIGVLTGDGAGGMKTLATVQNGTSQYGRCGGIDINDDKKLDIWGDDMIGPFSLFINNGANPPGFSMVGNVGVGTRDDEQALDVNGDSKTDLVLLQSMPSGANGGTSYSVGVALNDMSFGLMTNNNSIAVPNTGTMVTGDFDGNGKPDVAILEKPANGKSAVDILSGDGAELIYSETIAIGKDGPSSIAAGDLDGDGKSDLVIGLSNGVAVLMSQTVSP